MRDDPRGAGAWARSPGPPRCIAAGVRGLKRAQARFSNSPLTLPPSAFILASSVTRISSPFSGSGAARQRRASGPVARPFGAAAGKFVVLGLFVVGALQYRHHAFHE